MQNLNSYVRDFYFFRRNHYPQLSMVHMDQDEASRALQKQVGSKVMEYLIYMQITNGAAFKQCWFWHTFNILYMYLSGSVLHFCGITKDEKVHYSIAGIYIHRYMYLETGVEKMYTTFV